EAAGLKSVAFVADLERGFRYPSPDVLRRLSSALQLPLAELRELDRRAPIAEIRGLTERNPAWAAAFRRVVDAANAGNLTPEQLVRLVTTRTEQVHEGMLDFS